jgi:hypothetical protein
VDLREGGTRDRLDRAPEQPAQRSEAQRAELEPLVASGEVCLPGREWLRARGARRREDADRLRVHASYRIAKRARRERIDPLEVVDREDRRSGGGKPANRVEHRAAPLERVPVESERLEVQVRVLEQVDETHPRERHLLFRRPRFEYLVPGLPAARHRVPPEQGLADPRFPLDHHRAGAGGRRRDEAVDSLDLVLAPDENRRVVGGWGGGDAHGQIMHPSTPRRY